MKTFYKISALLIFSFFTAMSFAQINNQVVTNQIQFEECSLSPIMTPQQRLIYDQARQVRSNWEKAETILDFPIQFHIIRETNGTGGLDPLELQGIMNGLNSYYINANIQFYECSNVNYIDDSGNYDFLSTNKTSFTSTHDISGVINIYFFNSICSSGCGGTAPSMLCGQSTFPASMGVGGGSASIIMDNGCAINGSTMTHEVGHFFSLLHTHETYFGAELVTRGSGANCSTAGDELCGTAADPNLNGLVNTSCVYTGTATDANGATYVPDPTNIMSYSKKYCRTFLDNAQYNRINYSAVNDPDRNNLTGSSCGNPDLYITNESYNTFSGPNFGTSIPVNINGTNITFNVDVENSTAGSGTTPSELGYYLSSNWTISTSDYLLGYDVVNSLAPGGSVTTTSTFNLSSSLNSIPDGLYYIGAIADYSQLVTETSGSNNDACFRWTTGIMTIGGSLTYQYYQISLVSGCTNPIASNYDPTANRDDGSCIINCATLPYSENFDIGIGTMINNGWILDSGQTPTGSFYNTGPTDDVTGGGNYMYYETSTGYQDTVTISTECLDLSSLTNPMLTFHNHMYGINIGTLEVLVNGSIIWSQSGDQGNQWNQVDYPLSAWLQNNVNIQFRAIYGGSYQGDIAIDEISVYELGCTNPSASNYNPAATVDDGSCILCLSSNSESFESPSHSRGPWSNWTYDNGTSTFTAYNGWRAHYSGTTSPGTGPSGAYDGTWYLYCETSSPNYGNNQVANLISSCVDMSSFNSPIFSFAYHMYGATMGTLDVQVSNDGGATWVTEWTKSGDQGQNWTQDYISLLNYTGSIQVRMSYTAGSSYTGDCAIDLLEFIEAPAIPGCTDSLACNYDPTAIVDDSSCVYLSNPAVDLTQGSWVLSYDWGCTGNTSSSTISYNSNGTANVGMQHSTLNQWIMCGSNYTHTYSVGASYSGTYANGIISGTTLSSSGSTGCFTLTPLVITCNSPQPTGFSVTDITHDRAKVNWADANTATCMVDMYRVQYRVQGTNTWSQKTAMGSGLCQFGLTTTNKRLWNLTPASTYEYRVKAWYCGTSASTWSSISTFSTLDECADVVNFAVSTPTITRATFTWSAPATPYSFVRIKLRVDTLGSTWLTAGGFGVMYPTLTRNKNGLVAGESYRASSRTWCDPNGGAYKALTWSPFIFWTQPGGSIRITDSENAAITDLSVYPNPSREIFNVTFVSDEVQNLDISITNVVGEAVYSADLEQFVGQFTKEVSLATYPKGVYFLQITTDKGVVTKKLNLQ